MSQGIAPIPLVPVPWGEGLTLPRPPVRRGLTVVARVLLAALVVVVMAAGAAVATGRTEIPLQALAAIRTPGAVPVALPVRPDPSVPVLKVGTVMNLPLAGVAGEARMQTAKVVEGIEARQAAARAAERRAAAQRAARQAAQEAAAQRAAAQRRAAAAQAARLAAQRAAAQEVARQAAAAEVAREAAAEAAAEQAAQQEAAEEEAVTESEADNSLGFDSVNSGSGLVGQG